MDEFRLERTPDGDRLRVHTRGAGLLRYPLYNKGAGFTHEERRRLCLEGLLPAQYNDIDTQAQRIFRSIFYNKDPVGRAIGLASLQDRNETLFYKVLQTRLADTMPIVYTPTVGKASQYYSRVYRRARGIFITPEYKGRIEQVLRDAAPFAGVRLMVVTDNEAILGIGDQGAGGMAISVGKLALYCVGAGIHPARTLPISLDVGTNNRDLLDDPLYLGWRHERLRGDAYFEIVDEFVAAAKSVFPDVVIQWEDFRKDNALQILDRYADSVPSFNDDIQGTGAVAVAAIRAGCRISGQQLAHSKSIIFGAGAAGLGIARQLRENLRIEGLNDAQLQQAVMAMDSRGVIVSSREGLDDYKKELAWSPQQAAALGLADDDLADLAKVARAYGATVLVGTSGQKDSFDRAVVSAMADNTRRPIILPMSNPTDISEGTPADILEWTAGRALLATGSPFDDVDVGGAARRIGQANNVFVFPGIGLGTIVSGARAITDNMIAVSSAALAGSMADDDRDQECLMPDIGRLWDVCGRVALAVAEQAVEDGVAPAATSDELDARLAVYRWQPRYPEIIVDET